LELLVDAAPWCAKLCYKLLCIILCNLQSIILGRTSTDWTGIFAAHCKHDMLCLRLAKDLRGKAVVKRIYGCNVCK
jgi:hypothetical protein